MSSLRFSFVFLFALGFVCLANGNPISNFFGKSGDEKAEADKTTVTTASTAKSAGETTTTTTTPQPGSSCGGLKGFLHICDKNVPTEPPKSVKKRSAEEDDSDEDEDDDSKSENDDDNDNDDDDDDDDDNDDNDEKPNMEEEKQNTTKTSPVSSEPTEAGIAKRQVGDPGAPVLGEIPPIVANAMEVAKKPEENYENKRQADESESDSDEDDEVIEYSRRRRDCRDREGDYNKDCRRKREYVPPCYGLECKHNATTEANE